MNINTSASSSMVSNFQSGRPGGGKPAGIEEILSQGQNTSSSGDSLSVSPMGQMLSELSNMSTTDRAEMQKFGSQMAQDVKSGTFDAAAAAEEAPEALKSLAEENGMDLTSMLEHKSKQMGQMGGGGRPQGMGVLSSYTQEADSATTLLESLLKESESDEKNV